jgi:hypothetical protein
MKTAYATLKGFEVMPWWGLDSSHSLTTLICNRAFFSVWSQGGEVSGLGTCHYSILSFRRWTSHGGW